VAFFCNPASGIFFRVETKERESREEERGREAIVTRKRSGEPGFFLSTIYLTNYIVIARFFGLKNSMPGQ
jgi:hypothetical protein